jgi:V8-like Glu-specific endopeptidase
MTQRIMQGEASVEPDHDAVVAIAFEIESGVRSLDCSGVLVAPNLVLTSRFCVAERTPESTWSDLPATRF